MLYRQGNNRISIAEDSRVQVILERPGNTSSRGFAGIVLLRGQKCFVTDKRLDTITRWIAYIASFAPLSACMFSIIPDGQQNYTQIYLS